MVKVYCVAGGGSRILAPPTRVMMGAHSLYTVIYCILLVTIEVSSVGVPLKALLVSFTSCCAPLDDTGRGGGTRVVSFLFTILICFRRDVHHT